MFHKDLARRSFLKTGLLAAPLSSALVNPGMAKETGDGSPCIFLFLV
jgi:hypothetical protein